MQIQVELKRLVMEQLATETLRRELGKLSPGTQIKPGFGIHLVTRRTFDDNGESLDTVHPWQHLAIRCKPTKTAVLDAASDLANAIVKLSEAPPGKKLRVYHLGPKLLHLEMGTHTLQMSFFGQCLEAA